MRVAKTSSPNSFCYSICWVLPGKQKHSSKWAFYIENPFWKYEKLEKQKWEVRLKPGDKLRGWDLETEKWTKQLHCSCSFSCKAKKLLEFPKEEKGTDGSECEGCYSEVGQRKRREEQKRNRDSSFGIDCPTVSLRHFLGHSPLPPSVFLGGRKGDFLPTECLLHS